MLKNRFKQKKGQVQMSETIAVMFIFFILVVFGLIFYFKFSTIAAQQAEEELFGQKAIDTTTKVIFLPGTINVAFDARILR